MESFFGHLKSEAFYSQKITKVSNTTVRKIVLEYIHYYNCVRIQEKLNHLSLKNLGNKWFRCFDWCPVFGVHFTLQDRVLLYAFYYFRFNRYVMKMYSKYGVCKCLVKSSILNIGKRSIRCT